MRKDRSMRLKNHMKCDFMSFTGAVRSENQDGILINNDVKAYGKANFTGSIEYDLDNVGHLFAVADGAGGLNYGYECSSTLLKSLNKMYRDMLSLEGREPLELLTKDALENASKEIQEIIGEGEGATTISLLWINPKKKKVFYFNMGDSPIWLYRKGKCYDIYEKHADGNILKQYVGKSIEGNGNFGELKLKRNDVFLIASDGIFALNEEGRQQFIASEDDYESLAEQVVNSICKDNVSFLKIRMI